LALCADDFELDGATAVNPDANNSPRLDRALEEIPVVILVGGLGTRLRSVLPSAPKPLAPVGGTPFLELLVLQLRSQGVRRIVMCTGYLADQINERFGDGRKWGVAIGYSNEPHPLGTAGAVKFAEAYLEQDAEFLVMNGDSFLEVDLRQLISFHRNHGGLMTMAVRRIAEAARYGTVEVNKDGRVIRFAEKTAARIPGIINGGVYVFNHDVLRQITEGPVSFERDVFPHLLEQGVYALELHGMFIDIGTPEDYARAQELYGSLAEAALPKTKSAPSDPHEATDPRANSVKDAVR
jgi:NDP-sugar pyrophosphorylase family protein